ncbi:MAG: hypothetical protein ACO4BU_04820 [Phycisphaerales bacterium]
MIPSTLTTSARTRLQFVRLIPVAIASALLAACGGDEASPVPPTPIGGSRPEPAVRPVGENPVMPLVAVPPTSIDPTDPQNWRITGPDDEPTKVELGGLHSRKPASWTWQRPSMQFRTLQFTVPGRDGAEAADLVFSLFFDREGGPTELNVDRWNRQFLDEEGQPTTPVQRQNFEFEMPVLFVEHRGSYLQMGAAAPRGGYAQLAGVIDAPKRRVFVRLVGPEATVEANRAAFMEMLRTFRPINFTLPG